MMNTIALPKNLGDLKAFVAGELNNFQPFAYYDKHLDCIRVQILDCSITEERLNRIFTLYHANHYENETIAGFSIKGIRHLFASLGIKLHGAMRIAELLDTIVKNYPDKTVKYATDLFLSEPGFSDMEVSFDEAA